jgi:hypothetical protein
MRVEKQSVILLDRVDVRDDRRQDTGTLAKVRPALDRYPQVTLCRDISS